MLITFENIVQILISLYHYVPMQILTISHLSFSNNVTVRHIGANEKQFFRYSSFKCCSILPKIWSEGIWTELHRNDLAQ